LFLIVTVLSDALHQFGNIYKSCCDTIFHENTSAAWPSQTDACHQYSSLVFFSCELSSIYRARVKRGKLTALCPTFYPYLEPHSRILPMNKSSAAKNSAT